MIHSYDIRQSQEDHATVPIYCEPRQVKLHLSATDIDAAIKDITDGLKEAEETDLERRKPTSGGPRKRGVKPDI